MVDVRKIFLATDFSKISSKATDFAMELKKAFGCQLIVLHVFDDSVLEMPAPYYFMPQADHWWQEKSEKLRQKGKAALDQECRRLGEVTGHFLKGKPGPEIVDYCKEQQADLIVMGSHGFSGLDRLFLGSVSRYVLKHAHCPVLLVKPEQTS